MILRSWLIGTMAAALSMWAAAPSHATNPVTDIAAVGNGIDCPINSLSEADRAALAAVIDSGGKDATAKHEEIEERLMQAMQSCGSRGHWTKTQIDQASTYAVAVIVRQSASKFLTGHQVSVSGIESLFAAMTPTAQRTVLAGGALSASIKQAIEAQHKSAHPNATPLDRNDWDMIELLFLALSMMEEAKADFAATRG